MTIPDSRVALSIVQADHAGMKRSHLWIAAFIAFALVALIALKPVAETFVKNKLIALAKKECADCVVAVKDLDFSLANPGELVFQDVRFVAGQSGHSLAEVRFEKLVVDVAISKSSREKVIVNRIEGFGPDIVYADGDAPEIKAPEKASGGQVEFEIHETRLHDAVFKYAHTKKKKTSFLHFSHIDAEMSSIGSTKEAKEKMVTAKLTGHVEKSGRGQLNLAALVRKGPWYVDAVLDLRDQNLADLNAFFTPNDRIELQGIVQHVLAKVNVRDTVSKADVTAIYHDANYKEFKSEDRSAIEASIASLGASIMMTKTNVDFPPDQQKAEIEVKLDPDEPLVHYMLRSAKLGLLEVAKKKK